MTTDDIINFKIFPQPSSKAMPDWEKRKIMIQKREYIKKKKSFLNQIKSNFHNYLRDIIWLK